MTLYTKLISSREPGLVLILVDQSKSMTDPYGSTTKDVAAAEAVNDCIYELISRCEDDQKIRDRCHIVVIGYGDATSRLLVSGTPSELDKKPLRRGKVKKTRVENGQVLEYDRTEIVWVEPAACGGTPMHLAFAEAAEIAEAWVAEHPTAFPPVVINITDGEPDIEGAAVTYGQCLMELGTENGKLLLLNAHISDSGKSSEIIFPHTEARLPNKFAKLLYSISSELPGPMLNRAKKIPLPAMPGSRGLVMNAGAETLTQILIFGSR